MITNLESIPSVKFIWVAERKKEKKPKDSQGEMCWYFVAVSVESNYCKEDCLHKRCLSRERNQTQNSIIILLFSPDMCVALY